MVICRKELRSKCSKFELSLEMWCFNTKYTVGEVYVVSMAYINRKKIPTLN